MVAHRPTPLVPDPDGQPSSSWEPDLDRDKVALGWRPVGHDLIGRDLGRLDPTINTPTDEGRLVLAFLLDPSGRLVTGYETEATGLDPDTVAGMLQAVSMFVQDAFGRFAEPQDGRLRRMEFGTCTILMDGTTSGITMVTLVEGPVHPDFPGSVENFLSGIDRDHGNLLYQWDGDIDGVDGVVADLERFLLDCPMGPGTVGPKTEHQDDRPGTTSQTASPFSIIDRYIRLSQVA